MISLSTPVPTTRLTPIQIAALKKLGILTHHNLLWHFPSRYEDFSTFRTIRDAEPGQPVVIEGKILDIDLRKTWKRRVAVAEAHVADATDALKIIWFSQPYIAKQLKAGDLVRLRGKVTEKNGRRMMANPLHETIPVLSLTGPNTQLEPVYTVTRGITSRWIAHKIAKILSEEIQLSDPIPDDILARYHLPPRNAALHAIHFPRSLRESEAARKRFAFEEIFFIQLARQRERYVLEQLSAPTLTLTDDAFEDFLKRLPFTLTPGQQRVLGDIRKDMENVHPMARLLEGDVGSGKTVIAAALTFIATANHFQVAYMAPTEILARQHFEAFSTYFHPFKTKVGLLTSSECRVYPSKAFMGKSARIPRTQLLKWIHMGDIRILIGTHALIQKHVAFDNLGLIIVDEQHRFGVRQRAALARTKSRRETRIPHFLSMTATPIPRTLALTIYGDLDLSILDELPPGRKPIETIVAKDSERSTILETLRIAVESGRQAYVICPRIEEKDDSGTQRFGMSDMKSVEKETKKLKALFPNFSIEAIHGNLAPKVKDAHMKQFASGNIDILVSTTVVEVGVDVPNSTVMLVENADRFGLAQLHQLRGRIGRGKHQSTFFALSESSGSKTLSRLQAMKTAKNGFELAERDLEIRGAGELSGGKQWGISDIGMEALKNIKMVEAARMEARRIIERNPDLQQYPQLRELMESSKSLHFE